MKKYITQYKVDGKKYGCELYADSELEAKEHLRQKRKTEKILGCDPTIEYLKD